MMLPPYEVPQKLKATAEFAGALFPCYEMAKGAIPHVIDALNTKLIDALPALTNGTNTDSWIFGGICLFSAIVLIGDGVKRISRGNTIY